LVCGLVPEISQPVSLVCPRVTVIRSPVPMDGHLIADIGRSRSGGGSGIAVVGRLIASVGLGESQLQIYLPLFSLRAERVDGTLARVCSGVPLIPRLIARIGVSVVGGLISDCCRLIPGEGLGRLPLKIDFRLIRHRVPGTEATFAVVKEPSALVLLDARIVVRRHIIMLRASILFVVLAAVLALWTQDSGVGASGDSRRLWSFVV
jgi:hypothetical protein